MRRSILNKIGVILIVLLCRGWSGFHFLSSTTAAIVVKWWLNGGVNPNFVQFPATRPLIIDTVDYHDLSPHFYVRSEI